MVGNLFFILKSFWISWSLFCNDLLAHSSIHSFIHSVINLFVHGFNKSLNHLFICVFEPDHLFIYSFNHSPFGNSLIHPILFNFVFIVLSFIYWFTHSFTHRFKIVFTPLSIYSIQLFICVLNILSFICSFSHSFTYLFENLLTHSFHLVIHLIIFYLCFQHSFIYWSICSFIHSSI